MNPIFQEALAVVFSVLGAVLTTLIGIYIPRIIAVAERLAHIRLTEQQVASLNAAANTGAALLTQKLRDGVLTVQHLTPTSPTVLAEAAAALSRVPDAAAGQQTSVQGFANVIAARVGQPVLPAVPAVPVGAPAGPILVKAQP
jgi:hypothetical protein